MNYNKSKIMKMAWEYLKENKVTTFRKVLILAWKDSTNGTETVTANKLSVGDTIEIQYGNYENVVKCVVQEISDELFLDKYHVVKAISTLNGMEVEFCTKQKELLTRFVENISLSHAA